MDHSTTTQTDQEDRGSMCSSSLDVDSVSSPETLCPVDQEEELDVNDDDVDEEGTAPISSARTVTAPSLVFPVSLKDLNLREIKAVKIIRNGASSVLAGVKATASATAANVPDAIKRLLAPVQVSISINESYDE